MNGCGPYFLGFSIIFIFYNILLAIYFLTGHGSFLIAGYNTLSKAEKEKYNEKALCKAMGQFALVLAAVMTILLYSIYTENTPIIYIGTIGIILWTFGWIIYLNKSKKFMKE